jgi:DNA uptake protein ComE-like DNA-binding protein
MGLFKEFKDMKDMVSAAPGMMESAQQLGANAQAQAAAAQAQAAQFQAPGGAQAYVNNLNAGINGEPSAEALKPINGVSLEAYTAVIKELGARGNDQSLLPEIAQSKGIKPADWEKAKEGWGARIKDDRALGTKFNTLYTSA